VDFEIYNSSGQQVFQKYFESQSFSANQQKSFSVNWTAGSNGNYTFKTGIFSGNWSTNYYWNDSVTTIPVGGSAPPPNPQPNPNPAPQPAPNISLEVWWPSDGSSVSGVQPFKAILTDTDVSAYKMYWQVDGDALNEMADNPTDYPHKEADVDLTNWNWKGSGPYNINFVAKDAGGNILKQKSVNINVIH
jgi:hypothetical protein